MKTSYDQHSVPRPVLSEVEIDALDLKLTSKSLESEVLTHFTTSQIKIIKKLVYYTSQIGLTIEEACTLTNFPFEDLKNIMQKEPLVAKIISMKELEFKKDMLHTVAVRARNGDDKLALWLLERRYPEQFAQQKNRPSEDKDKNFLFQAIEFIQRSGDSAPLVSNGSSQSIVVKQGVITKVDDILV